MSEPWLCPICDKPFPDVRAVMTHVHEVHRGAK